MAEAAAFLFGVEPRDSVVRFVNDHVLDGEVEAFPEERVALPRYGIVQAVVFARLEDRRIEPGVRDDSVAAVESGRDFLKAWKPFRQARRIFLLFFQSAAVF